MPVSFISGLMRQHLTYWAPLVNDGFGNVTFSPPIVLFPARWQDVAELFIDLNGQEQTSEAVVYVDRELQVKGYLCLGIHAEENPRDNPNAHEIRQTGVSPSLKADRQLNKVWL